MLAGSIALFGAGFAFDWIRARFGSSHPAQGRRSGSADHLKLVLAVVAIALPGMTLVLAKLFESDVLGWIFGLMLMAGVATLPCVLIFHAGMKLHSWIGGTHIRSTGRPTTTTPVARLTMLVRIERGSVHASDDAPSARIEVPAETTVRALVEKAIAAAPLPTICGGRATWWAELSGDAGELPAPPIAVCAQQWPEPVFLIPERSPMAALVNGNSARLAFHYQGQDDPLRLLEQLRGRLDSALRHVEQGPRRAP